MENNERDSFEDFIKKWSKRVERIAFFLSWVIHLFLILGISVVLTYYHITEVQEGLHKKSAVAESRTE